MATQVKFESVLGFDNSLCFRFDDNMSFRVISFNKGVMVIEPISCYIIDDLAENIAGCFESSSNFYGLKAIEFTYKGVSVLVKSKNATPQEIVQLYEKKLEENRIKERNKLDEYMKSPKYRAEKVKTLKLNYRRKNVEELIKHSMQTVELEFKDDYEARKIWDAFIDDFYNKYDSPDTVRYAEYWVKFMQYLIDTHKGVTVDKIAEQTSQDVAAIQEITGFTFNCIVKLLSHVWKYGDELEQWSDKKHIPLDILTLPIQSR